MAISDTWSDPSEGGTLDLSAGDVLTAAVWEKVMSNLLRLGGTTGAPVSFTPTVRQGGTARTLTWSHSYYWVVGKVAYLDIHIKVGQAGTAGNDILIGGWPTAINPVDYDEMATCGTGSYYDADTTTTRVGNARHGYESGFVATSMTLCIDGASADRDLGVDPAITLASGDLISIKAFWRIA